MGDEEAAEAARRAGAGDRGGRCELQQPDDGVALVFAVLPANSSSLDVPAGGWTTRIGRRRPPSRQPLLTLTTTSPTVMLCLQCVSGYRSKEVRDVAVTPSILGSIGPLSRELVGCVGRFGGLSK